ncbi:MAG: hypothetical protein AB1649_30715 [Chloroflexota bacterium]
MQNRSSNLPTQFQTVVNRITLLIFNKRGDDYAQKAVILVVVVLAGVAAFAAFGNRIIELINQASSGI